MSTKKHIRELLSVYLDQMCSDEEKKIVESHLAECAECRQELAGLRKTIILVAGLKEINPPADLWAGIEQRIQKKSFWEIFDWRPVPVAAATVVIFLMAVAINKYTVKVAEQEKAGTRHDITAGSSLPLTSPLLTPKYDQKLEEAPRAAKSKASPGPLVESVRKKAPVSAEEDSSDYAVEPRSLNEAAAISKQKDQLAEANLPLKATLIVPPLFQNLERKMIAVRAKTNTARAIDALYSDEALTVAGDGSVYVSEPQQIASLTAISRQKGRIADTEPQSSSSYDIVMEVDDLERTRQRLEAVAENYQARQVDQSVDNQELSYQVQHQEFPNFISEVNKLGRDPRRKDASTGMRETIAANRFGARPTTEPQLIRIKITPNK